MTAATRRLPAASYAALKTGTRALVDELGGFDAAAGFTRIGPTRLHDCCNRHKPDDFAPIDVIADLQDVERDPVVTSRLAALIGHHVVLLQVLDEGCEARAVAEVMRDAAELAAAWVEAMGDGTLSEAERAAVLQRLSDLRRAVDRAMSMLTRRITTEGQRKLGLAS